MFEERLRQMGQWLNVNGEGIYKTQPWTYQNDTTNPNTWSVVCVREGEGGTRVGCSDDWAMFGVGLFG